MFYKVLLAVLGLCVAFEMKCPEPAQWSMRAKLHCINPSFYYCLLSIDGNKGTHVENCSKEDFQAPGKRIVIRGNFDACYCSNDKYQPITYWTNLGSDCLFLTSTCTEEGQVVNSVDQKHEGDNSCRCDHTTGYDFVTRPNNPCFCIPSQEDCSCYKKNCSAITSTLSRDYKCIEEIPKGVSELCTVPNITRVGTSEVIFSMFHKINNTDHVRKGSHGKTALAVLLVITIFTCTVFFCANEKYCIKDYFKKPLESQTCIEGFDAHFECEIRDVITDVEWMKDGNKINATEKYKIDMTGNLLKLTVINTELSDAGEYSVKINNCILRKTQLTVKENEERRSIRVFLIGKDRVGKTSLLRRLMDEGFDEKQTSTDGIKVDIHRCKISASSKEWVIEKDSNVKKALVKRLAEVYNPNTNKTQITKTDLNIYTEAQDRSSAMQDGKPKDSDKKTKRLTDMSPSTKANMPHKNVSQANMGNEQDLPESTHKTNAVDSTTHAKDSIDSDKTAQTLTDQHIAQISKELDDFLKEVKTSALPDDTFYDVGFWDFAGEKDYYETHQVFLNPNALFLLVTCVSDDNTNDPALKSAADNISFWLNTVHLLAFEEKGTLNPSIIVVCTGIDKWKCKDKDELRQRKDEFKDEFYEKISTQHNQAKHVKQFCFVSNREPDEHDFNALRKVIYNYGMDLETCNETIPAKWIPLELLLHAVSDAGENILPLGDIKTLAEKCSIKNEGDVKRFLEYQHKVGNIIYLEKIPDYIILSQQWLANAFKCLVTNKVDDRIQNDESWRKLRSTGELEEELITQLFEKEETLRFNKNKQQHILKLMEAFDILAKPTESNTYYLPCMIQRKQELNELYAMFSVTKTPDHCTPWLILEFNFMPFFMYQHVVVYFLRRYFLCEEKSSKKKTIYHNKAVFYIDKSRSYLLVACYLENAISLQIWKREDFKSDICEELLQYLKWAINEIKQKCVANDVQYAVKAKCYNGNIYSDKERKGVDVMTNGRYYCEEHGEFHTTEDLSKTWFKRYANTEISPPVKTTRTTAKLIDWRKVLFDNTVAIMKGVANVEAVADILICDNILTLDMYAQIMQEKESEKKARKLLDILGRHGETAVCYLYKAFKETQNEALADLLIPYVEANETFEKLMEPKKWPPTTEEQAELKLMTINSTRSPWLHEYNKDDVYKMHKKIRGMVFIINNENFKNSGKRLGTVPDGKNMTKLFQQLQFNVIERKDLPAKEMVNFLEAERNKVDWNEMECFVLILMSHGEDCNILGSDDEPVPLKTLTDLFSSAQCKYLDGKPRLVFVQASRSESECKKTATDSKTSEQNQKEDQTDSVPYKQTSDQKIKDLARARDFLVAYATPEGTPTYRNIHTGSWFLTAVIWTFKTYAYREELLNLLIRVNRLAARGEGKSTVLSTVSKIQCSLTKKFYFFPGVYDNPPRLVEK